MKNLIYIAFILCFHCSLYAEQHTVNFFAKVKMSESPQVILDQEVEITLVYDLSPNGSEFPGHFMTQEGGSFNTVEGMYNDLTPSSKITANFLNGLIVETSVSANPFLNINSSVIDFDTGVFKRNVSFSSNSPNTNTGVSVQSIDIYFDEVFYQQPNPFKSDWNKKITQYEIAEFYMNIDGATVLADITSIETQALEASVPSIVPSNVSFRAKVIESQVPMVSIDEIIEGVLSYDLNSALDYNEQNQFPGGSSGGLPMYYMANDETPGSQIIAYLPNGQIVRTPYSAQPFLTLDTQITDHNNGNYEREASFTSGNTISNPTQTHMGIYFKETFSQLPNILKTDWSKSLTAYDHAEFYLGVNGQYIIAELIELALELEEAPPTIELNATLSLTGLSNQGGEVTISNNAINNTEQSLSIKHWQYITMPNGSQYPISLPAAHTLTELQTYPIVTTFTVPSYWPVGTYIHHITTIAVEDGQVFSKSTSFTKSE